jgi:guanyl-specific ribonuclease Sa
MRISQLLLCVRVTTLSDEIFAKLAAGHGKPERALQLAEGIDRSCESSAGSVAVLALSRNARFPSKDVRVDRRLASETKVVSHQPQQLNDLGNLAQQEGGFHRLDERRPHPHRKGLIDAGAKGRLGRCKRKLVVTFGVRDRGSSRIVLGANLQVRVRDKRRALLDEATRRRDIAAKHVQPCCVDCDSQAPRHQPRDIR